MNQNSSQATSQGQINFNRLQRLDFFRNFFLGSLLPIIEVILMLIFINQLKAGLWEKTFLVIFVKFGFIIGIPLSLYVFSRNFELNKTLWLITLLSSLALFYIHWVDSVLFFIFLSMMIAFPFHGTHPMLTEIYSLYPSEDRGKRFVTSNIGLFLGSIVFALIYNLILKEENPIDPYLIILTLCALSVAISGCFFFKIPKVKFTGIMKPNWKTLLKIVRKDRFFVYVLFTWNLFGMANLWLLSYRTNLLVEDQFGFHYSEKMVLLLLTVIPESVYLLLTFPFAFLFDRINFIALRIGLNVLMLGYVFFFFFGENWTDHLIGSIFFGSFKAGGSIAWRLWINKMVPQDKVSLYTTVHVGITGLRMVLSPMVGLFSLYYLGPRISATISLIMVGISILMLIPLIPFGKSKFHY